MARLAQALPHIHMFQRTVVARDIPDTHAMELNTAYACAAGTAKPIGTSFGAALTALQPKPGRHAEHSALLAPL